MYHKHTVIKTHVFNLDIRCSSIFQILTKDSVTVSVDAVVYYRVYDPVNSIINVEDASHSTRLLAQTTLRNILGTKTLADILGDRDVVSSMMQVNNNFMGERNLNSNRNHTSSQRQIKTSVLQGDAFHQHYSTFTLQTYHQSEHRFRTWPTQMTSPSHLHIHSRV